MLTATQWSKDLSFFIMYHYVAVEETEAHLLTIALVLLSAVSLQEYTGWS